MARARTFKDGVRLSWLDATATLVSAIDNRAELKERVQQIVGVDVVGHFSIVKQTNMLLQIWQKTAKLYPQLHADAVVLFQNSYVLSDRLWLHYGLALLSNVGFEHCTNAIGRVSRFEDDFVNRTIARQVMVDFGPTHSLERTVRGVVWSLRDWGLLQQGHTSLHYVPCVGQLRTSSHDFERWLLRVALTLMEQEEVPFQDLIRQPFLFPFRFSVGIGNIRNSAEFAIERQGLGLNMVRLDA